VHLALATDPACTVGCGARPITSHHKADMPDETYNDQQERANNQFHDSRIPRKVSAGAESRDRLLRLRDSKSIA